MKKLGTVLAACCLGLAMTACGTSTIPDTAGSAAPDDTTTPIENDSAIDQTGSAPNIGSAVGSGSAANTSDPNTRAFGDCTVSILDYSIRPDSEGEPALRVVYEFTNNSQKSASFSTTVVLNAYQKNSPAAEDDRKHFALPYAKPSVLDNEYTRMLTLIEPGESITCAAYFKLLDSTTPVDIKISDLRNSSADALERTLTIEGMEMDTEDEQEASGSGSAE